MTIEAPLTLMRILLVDDDQALIALLKQNLGEQHYAIDTAPDGEMAWDYVNAFTYDLIVLDVMLPKVDGISLCRQLRKHGHQMLILLLTAQDTSTAKIKGLDAGADDYVVKPCDLEELTARIRALLRREREARPPILQWGDLSLDPRTSEVNYGSRPLQLTPKEYALLELFLRNPNRVFSLEVILDKVWPADELPGVETVRTHIKALRRKLKTASAPSHLIETVYGLGYRSPSPPEASPLPLQTVGSSPPHSLERDAKLNSDMLAAITETWAQFKDQMMERLLVLDAAASALGPDPLLPDLHQQAQRVAHSLAGTLGTFGFEEGSRLARELEQTLQQTEGFGPTQVLAFCQQVAALREQMQGAPQLHEALSSPSIAPLILVIADDVQFTQSLEVAVANHDLRLRIAPNVSLAQAQLQTKQPDVVLLKLVSADAAGLDHDRSLTLIETLTKQTPTVPVVVIIAPDQWLDRREAVRRGARLCLELPLTPAQVITAVTKVLDPVGAGAKIMIVDDDPQLLQALPILLKPWGFECTTLADPQHFWPMLTAVDPALLVLDVDMPHINGIELCQLLRCDARWCQLPILFLTALKDAHTQEQVFISGADDYIMKPVIAAELATRMLNRLERVRLIKDNSV